MIKKRKPNNRQVYHLSHRASQSNRNNGPHSGDNPLEVLLLNKPFQVMSQFRPTTDGKRTLAEFITQADIYPAGRLDYDSEGLMVLCSDGRLQAIISSPRFKLEKTYWAQVEGIADQAAADALLRGVMLKDGPARALRAGPLPTPTLWSRDPPIRYRKSVADSWLSITIDEGRNRQVRRMTAAVGLPTLRLVRVSVGPWHVNGLAPGETRMEIVRPSALQRPQQSSPPV